MLRSDNELLRERVAYLEDQFISGDVPLPLEWRLTSSESRVFGALLARERATKQTIMSALYLGRQSDEAQIKIVDVFVCKMRKKLKPFGIGIITTWGEGYRLDPETRKRLREMRVEVQKAEAA